MHDTTKNPWIDCWLPRPEAGMRLFCFPHVGGASTVYRQWAQAFNEKVEVCAVELPGRGLRFGEKLHTDLKDLVFSMQVEMQNYLDKPYAFFGHSMGALIAFEWTRLIRQSALPPPQILFVSGFGAVHLPKPEPQRLHALPNKDLLASIERLKGTPSEVLQHRELMELLLPIIRADLQMVETYSYEKQMPLDIPLIALGGDHDPEVEPSRLKAWKDQTSERFEFKFFEGEHFFIQSAREEVIKFINQEIQSVL